MSTLSPRLSLVTPASTGDDDFEVADFDTNYAILDGAPGIYIAPFATAPTWGVEQTGRLWLNSDDNLIWVFTGTTFVRTYGKGVIGTTHVVTDQAVTATTPTSVISVTVTVPESNGTKTIRVEAQMPAIKLAGGSAGISFVVDGTTVVQTISLPSTGYGGPLSIFRNIGILSAGSHTISVDAFVESGATLNLYAAVGGSFDLVVSEV